MARFYTGIGAKNTPKYIQIRMRRIAYLLDKKGYTLRSGGAYGADTAFEIGSKNKEIYLPFKNFNNSKSKHYKIDSFYYEVAKLYVPYFNNIDEKEQKFIARDIQQVINDGIKSEFVICWTKDGAINASYKRQKTGGTYYAIALASYLNIPVINLRNIF